MPESKPKPKRPRVGDTCPYCSEGLVGLARIPYADRTPKLWAMDGLAFVVGAGLTGYVLYRVLQADTGSGPALAVAAVLGLIAGVGAWWVTMRFLVPNPSQPQCEACGAAWALPPTPAATKADDKPFVWGEPRPPEPLAPASPPPAAAPAPSRSSSHDSWSSSPSRILPPLPLDIPVCPLCHWKMERRRDRRADAQTATAATLLLTGVVALWVAWDLLRPRWIPTDLAERARFRDEMDGAAMITLIVAVPFILFGFFGLILTAPGLRCANSSCRYWVRRG